jgi:hypothetical protein
MNVCGESVEKIPAKELASASDIATVVASCDGYADVWPAFFNLLFRFWPDRPYPLYLISNHLAFPDERVTALRVGDDLSWSETLGRGLERISSRFVLLILEDFFFTGPVDTAFIGRLHAAMVAKDAVYLRLVPNPRPDAVCPDMPHVGKIAKGAPYRTSLQIAFWDRLVLLSLLRQEESAWNFELKGSRRSDEITRPFLSVCEGISAISYRHVVLRGKFMPEAIRYFTPLGISFDLSKRSVESELYLQWQASAPRRHLGRAWRFITRRSL